MKRNLDSFQGYLQYDENAKRLDIDSQEYSEEDSSIENCLVEFSPSDIEKQVIRSTLALIRRSNMYDWDVDNSTIETSYMTLKENVIITDSELHDISCEIIVRVTYEYENTFCNILYFIDSRSHTLDMCWKSSPYDDNYLLTVEKETTTTSYFFFSQTVSKVYEVYVKDNSYFSWCYFPDVRYHLNRIVC